MTLKQIFNERLLLKQISEGDEQAFGILFYHYLPVLQAFALRFTKSSAAAEEIIQDTFLRVWLNRDKLDEVENVKAWLYKYASNECLGHLRKVLKQARAIDNLRQDQPNESNTTVDTIQLNEINHLITDAVDRLPTQRNSSFVPVATVMAYFPLASVLVAFDVPCIVTVTPGSGFPSAFSVTLPVTVTSCAMEANGEKNKQHTKKIRVILLFIRFNLG
jgi:RNA polymerase sigma factor (sigma-70 family)